MAAAKRAYPGSKRNGSRKGRFTTITVLGEGWTVPRGFGAAYQREAEHPLGVECP